MGIKRTRYKDGNYTIEVVDGGWKWRNVPNYNVNIKKGATVKGRFEYCYYKDFEEVKALINSGYVEFFEKNDAEKKREYWSLSEGERERQLDSIVCKYMDLYRTKQKELVNAYYERKFNNDDR